MDMDNNMMDKCIPYNTKNGMKQICKVSSVSSIFS